MGEHQFYGSHSILSRDARRRNGLSLALAVDSSNLSPGTKGRIVSVIILHMYLPIQTPFPFKEDILVSELEMQELNDLAAALDDGTWADDHGTIWRMGETVPITVTRDDDLASILLHDGYTTTPEAHRRGCYICEDPEFAQMGLPLCRKCPFCGGHIAADDSRCDDCGRDELEGV